jgi:hypothetical protein
MKKDKKERDMARFIEDGSFITVVKKEDKKKDEKG